MQDQSTDAAYHQFQVPTHYSFEVDGYEFDALGPGTPMPLTHSSAASGRKWAAGCVCGASSSG